MTNKEHISELLRHLASNGSGNSSRVRALREELRRESVSRPVIAVSRNGSGLIMGAEKTVKAIKQYLSERKVQAIVERAGSPGLPGAQPIVSIALPGYNRILFKNITAEKVTTLLDNIFNHVIPQDDVFAQIKHPLHTPWEGVPFLDDLDFFARQERRVLRHCGLIPPGSLGAFLGHGGYAGFLQMVTKYTPEEICKIIKDSGLKGRSGSGFPTGIKWEKTLKAPGDKKYVVCNALESDPGAFMERYLLENDPHTVVEGTAIAAYAAGAAQAYIYLSYENQTARNILQRALDQAREYGLLGDNIFDSGYNLQVSLFASPSAFVCGQEKALINSIEGKRGIPGERPPYPSEHGLFGHPTLINNVETLANVPLIIEKGAEWFKSTGTKNTPGTKVLSVSGDMHQSGIVEVPAGTSLRQVVAMIPKSLKENNKQLKAVMLGGPTGHIIPEKNLDITLDYEALKAKSLSMGSGGLVLMSNKTCMLDVARFIMSFLNEESCGKCITCREGVKNMLSILNNITRRPIEENGNQTLERFKGVLSIEDLAGVMYDTALCGLGENAPNVIMDTLKHFRTEYEQHIFERNCQANVCRDLRTFTIHVDHCVGCAACVNKCPTEAIYGIPRHPHFIIETKCIGCGLCEEACMFNAISEK